MRLPLHGRWLALTYVLSGIVLPHVARAANVPQERGPAVTPGVTRNRTNYHGWSDAWMLANGRVEAIIVPAVGRVMQFKFVDDADGPFWENRALDGKLPNPKSKEWGNFGGDKTWPAPQEDWPKVTGRAWPPPQSFDSMPVEVQTTDVGLALISPVDSHYGIRTRRVVVLTPKQPEMIITTTYEKVSGPSLKVAIWTISQLRDPIGVFWAPHPQTPWPNGFNEQSDALPINLAKQDGMLSLTRDPKGAHKIGAISNFLLWIGDKQALRIANPYVPNAVYPDHGSNAEVYTNPDPFPYVELEMLGPFHELGVGEKIEETRIYTLFRRTGMEAGREAKKLLGL